LIGNRTLLSLAQYLDYQPREFLSVIYEKHGLKETWDEWRSYASTLSGLIEYLRTIDTERLMSVLQEIAATEPDFRTNVVNAYGDRADLYAVRWRDLLSCLALDGFAVSRGEVVTLGPNVAGTNHVEDALSAAISASDLSGADALVGLLEKSADAFRRVPPDYNACLANTRTALQALGTQIAVARRKSIPGSFQIDKWGQVLSYLRTSGLITTVDENLISSVYAFISPGAHEPVGLSQEEMVRLGRGMAVSVCYFLVKLHNG
jgi:hypothetical protein